MYRLILSLFFCLISAAAFAMPVETAAENQEMVILPLSPQTLALVDLVITQGRHVAGIAFVVLAALFTVVFLLSGRLKGETEKRDAHAARINRLNAVLSVSPDGYFGWLYDFPGEDDDVPEAERPLCSRRLAVMLRLLSGKESSFEHVLACFDEESANLLRRSVGGLKRNGIGFEQEYRIAGDRRLRITGCRATEDDGTPLADILWFRDITHRQKTFESQEEKRLRLQEEKDKLEALLNSLPFPVWLRDADLSLVWCNRNYRRYVDAGSMDEVLSDGRELLSGVGARDIRDLASRARGSKQSEELFAHLVSDGERRLMNISERPVFEDGKNAYAASKQGSLLPSIPYTVGVAQDRSVEETLHADLERHLVAHEDVLEKIGSAVAVFGSDGYLAFFNDAYAKLWSLEREWLIESPHHEDILDRLQERHLLPSVPNYASFKEEERKRFSSLMEPYENLLHLPNGMTMRRILSPHPMGGVLALYEDVTDRLVLERSHKTLIAVQKETLDHLHEAVAVFGSDGRLRLVNPAYAALWQFSEADLSGEPHFSDLAEKQRVFFSEEEDFLSYREGVLALLNGKAGQEGTWERTDGQIFNFANVTLPDGSLLVTYVDVTDSAQVKKALKQGQEAVASANRMRARILSSLSEALKAPVSSIQGYADALSKAYFGDLNDKQQEHAEMIAGETRSLKTLVDDVLDMAAIESGDDTLSRDRIDIHIMAASVQRLLEEKMRRKNIDFSLNCPKGLGRMLADEKRIRQLLFNLLTNAVHFTPEGGRVSLSVMHGEKKGRKAAPLLFVVEDTGVGIPADKIPHVFELFASYNHGDDMLGGAGLGLPLVKKIVDLYKGEIEISSSADDGTKVTVSFPAACLERTRGRG